MNVAVLCSGGGSNLQALLDRFHVAAPELNIRVTLVITDRPECGAIERARLAGVATVPVPYARRSTAEIAADMLHHLEQSHVQLVALAGFIRHIPVQVVRKFRRRMINIHPALLPSFGGEGMYGRRVHQAVIASGVRVTGATVHYVSEEYDAGDIIAQWPVPVLHGDSPDVLAQRVLRVEHRLYPAVVEALVRGSTPRQYGDASFHRSDAAVPSEHDVRHTLGLE